MQRDLTALMRAVVAERVNSMKCKHGRVNRPASGARSQQAISFGEIWVGAEQLLS